MDLEARTRRIAIRVHTSEWGSFSFFLAGKLMIRRWYNDLIEVKLPERFREKFAAYLFTELRRRLLDQHQQPCSVSNKQRKRALLPEPCSLTLPAGPKPRISPTRHSP
jgi:hypothetical protein